MSTLVLVPTAFEAERLTVQAPVAVCGFGLAAAGAGAAHALATLHPKRAVLVGLAGTYDEERAPVGSALVATRAYCLGVGVGEGSTYLSAGQLGWLEDELELTVPLLSGSPLPAGPLLSVAAGSASPAQARERAERHPEALVEEMEGFAVALAARLAGTPLTIVRGVANVAGVREQNAWRSEEALAAAGRLVERIVIAEAAQ